MSNLRISELDFDQIKSNLKTYLKSQSQFTDYDFEGSSLSVLLDVLAYNTHYNAYLSNMLMNEMFLDSAVKRSSAVSIAKHLGYTPRSIRGAKADLNITVTSPTGLPAVLTLDKFTSFTSTVGGTSYTFLTTTAYTATRSGSNYTFSGVDVTEGTLTSFRHVVTNTTPDAKYEIPTVNIDTTTLQVIVQTSATDTSTLTYNLATDISSLTSSSRVFYLEQTPMGKYQIYFGDDVISKALSVGNIITLQYLAVSGTAVNVSGSITQSFAAAGTIGGSSDISITVNSNSTGGADEETITSIKFNAPKFNAAKNRLITTDDYESYIKAQVTEAESVVVWGGETNDPPFYGKVLISLKPFSGYAISSTLKENLRDVILANKAVISVTPEFIDPIYLYLNVVASVNFNPNLTSYTSEQIKTLVTNGITTFMNSTVTQFNKSFYSSQLTRYLMNLDSSILSITTELNLQRRFTPVINDTNFYTDSNKIKFFNKLHPGEIRSTRFFISLNGTQTSVYIRDKADDNPPNYEGTGTLQLLNALTEAIVNPNIGSVSYLTGDVSIDGITPTGFNVGQTEIQLTSSLQEVAYNITAVRNQIILLDDSSLFTLANREAGVTVTATAVIE
jgi:hypothetical protein